MNKRIILISGKAESGKDTLANILAEYSTSRTMIIHYADILKYVAEKYWGWNGLKDEAGRSLLQQVGSIIRERNPDYMINTVIQMIHIHKPIFDIFIVPDVRMPREITDIVQVYTDIRIDVVRVKTVRENSLTEEQRGHITETALDNYDFPYIIDNNGSLEDLRKRAYNLYHSTPISKKGREREIV